MTYNTDSSVIKFKGKAYHYEFPYLALINKRKDTLILDVRKIEQIGFTSNNAALNYAGAVIAADLTILFTIDGIKESADRVKFTPNLFVLPVFFAAGTYLLIKTTHIKMNTKTEWSFH